jgi:hypothetical protein
MRLKGISGTGRVLLNNAFKDVAVLVNDLHEGPCPAGCRCAPHQNHVSKRIHVICKPAIAGECEQRVMEGTIAPPHPLFIARQSRSLHGIKCRSQRTDAIFVKAFHRSPAGGHLEEKPDLEDFVEIVERALQDTDAMVAFKPDHAARTQIDQRFTNRSSRHAEACGKLPYRVEASGQKIARSDRIAKNFSDLLLEANLLSNRAEGVEARLGPVRPPLGEFFQSALIVAQELYLDHPQVLWLSPQWAARRKRNYYRGRP